MLLQPPTQTLNDQPENLVLTKIQQPTTYTAKPDFYGANIEPIKPLQAQWHDQWEQAEEARLQALQREEEAEQAKPRQEPKNVSYTPQTQPNDAIWDTLSLCESGGRWDYNGSSGFDGGLQFQPSTWNRMNTGYDFAWQAPREVQIEAGKRLQAKAGWGQWPECARRLGLL